MNNLLPLNQLSPETAMGRDLGAQLQADQPYVRAVTELAHLSNAIGMRPWLWTWFGR